MNISSLSIRGFRNLPDVAVDFEPDFTVLVGDNNSGKTNILDALYAALRVNRTIKQGAFDLHDYHLPSGTAMAGDAGPIELTLRFEERAPEEWLDDIISEFSDVLALDVSTDRNSVTLRVTSTASGAGQEETYEWAFLNEKGGPLTKRRFIGELNALQRLRPFYQLGALRDVSREFTKRSTYFSPFVTDPTFSDDLRTELSESLASINEKVLEVHEAFGTLRANIASGAAVVAGSSEVVIEAVPTRLSELLANTQVSMNSRGGATLPLECHGSGSQSMAVLSLFKAYVEAKLASRFDPLSRAILTLEEPESHLHPSAIRMLWRQLSNLAAQLILTTHSGDLLGELPLRCIRRIRQMKTGAKVYKADLNAFDRGELRNLEYGIQAGRGELFFANHWLLVEGRTEVVGLKRLAPLLDVNLHASGVRIVDCQQYGGVGPFVKLADQLGIAWHCICDGDESGRNNAAAAEVQLKGRTRDEHITQYSVNTVEAYLCTLGFDDIYMNHVPPEKAGTIVAQRGTDDHANQIGEAVIHRHKERAILEVCAAIEADSTRAPEPLRSIFQTCCRVAAQ